MNRNVWRVLETGYHGIELYLRAAVVRIRGGAGPAIVGLGADPDFAPRHDAGGRLIRGGIERPEREENRHRLRGEMTQRASERGSNCNLAESHGVLGSGYGVKLALL